MAKPRERDEHWDGALQQLRTICGELPGVTETLSYGNPTFKVGKKPFAVLDAYRNETCVWLLCDQDRREELLGKDGFFAAPYDRAKAAVCRSAADIDWPVFGHLLRDSYESCL